MHSHKKFDLVVVGAGIVGLAHAYEGLRRGLSVAVVEQAATVSGSSVQNFGHACITAQAGQAQGYADDARASWLDLADRAGFWAAATGTLAVARADDEMDLLEEFAATRAPGEVRLLGTKEVADLAPVRGIVGGAIMPRDLQVNPREAAPAIARWLAAQGVHFAWRTTATGVSTGQVETSRGPYEAPMIVVATNHDIDRLFPALAEKVELQRCRLHMLRVAIDLPSPLTKPLFTGWSLLRYAGFTACAAADRVRDRLSQSFPEAFAADLNQMYTPQPDGSIIVGDTHLRDIDLILFQQEAGFDLLLEVTRELFGVSKIDVLERWQGVYASSSHGEFLLEEPLPNVHVATVTTGIGMTTGLGIAAQTFAKTHPMVPA